MYFIKTSLCHSYQQRTDIQVCAGVERQFICQTFLLMLMYYYV